MTAAAPTSSVSGLRQSRLKFERMAVFAGVLFALAVIASMFVIQLSGAVIANGLIIRQGENIVLQHPDGGPIKEVFVQDGDIVEADDPLVAFDGTEVRSEYERLARQKLEMTIRLDRMEAALNGSTRFSASTLRGRSGGESEAARIVEMQTEALKAERQLIASQVEQARRRVVSAEEARDALTGQITANRERLALVDREIVELDALVKEQLVPRTRMTSLERERLEIRQRLEALELEDTRLKNEARSAQSQISSIRSEDKDRLWRQIEETEQNLASITRQLESLSGRLGRLEVNAPSTGRVHEIAVRNSGAVIRAGETILQLVPITGQRQVRVRIDPADIDDVEIGQTARLRFDTFKAFASEELTGEVLQISPDRSTDPATGLPYYSARIGLADEAAQRLAEISPEIGAPVTVMITTDKRSLANYLLDPVRRAMPRIFSES